MEAGSHNMAVGLAAFDYLSYPTVSLLLNSLFLRRVSVFFHLSLLFGIFASWIRVKSKIVQDQMHAKRGRMLYYRLVLFIFVALCLYNFGLCGLNYFFWYGNGWPEEKLVNMVDLLVRGFVSLACFIYLYTQFPTSGASRFPLILRVWWAFYVLISFYCLIIDWVENRKTNSLPVQFMVSDLIFAISSLVFCYAGLFGKRLKETVSLTEPLLNGNSASLPVEGLLNNSSSTENESSPYGNASFLSILTFTWVSRVISRGYKKALDIEDVPELAGADSVNGSYPIFKQSIESSMEGCGSSCKLSTLQLVKSLISTTWVDIMVTGLLALLNTCASYVGPYLIDTFVQYLNGNREYKSEGFALVSAFFFAKVIECFSQRHWFFRAQRAGLRARSVLVAMIYKKGLTLSGHSKQGQTSGEIINFMSVDAQRVGDFAWYMHDPWMVLLQVFLALLILFRNLGLASIAAFVVILLLMLANYPLSTKLEKFQDNLMQCKDRRMKATSEILKNMRILKLQAWEMKFLSKISQLRENEAGWLKKYLYTKAVLSFVFWSTPTFVSVVTFGTCIIMGIPLESGKILSALATFRILQEPIYSLPDTVSVVIQTKVSLDRLASFLSLADLQFDAVEVLPRECSVNAVEIIDGNFTWDDSSLAADSISLKDVNLSVSHGMRVAICGTVGSGKSSLLSCILGEMPKLSGMLRVSGSKAYVAQSAWIQSGKIVDNILFGKEMDCERYEMVLQACSLKKDLEVLSFGDQTVIGERGINLSGGQKQRIQIARALYQDADIYLFDDPFSAVDAHTGTHLFKECLLGYLSSKTVIYVTHQVEFLPAADLILVMKDGKISQAGKYSDILTSGSDFKELVGAHEKALSVLDSDNNTEEVCSNEDEKLQFVLDDGVTNSDISRVSCTEVDKSRETAEDQQLVQEEEREKGKVGWSVYWKYITTAYNGALVPVILLLQVLFQVLQIGSNYWIAWATPVSSDVKANVRGTTLIEVYSGLAAGSAFCILIRAILIATTAYKTATILFSKMHLSIFRAPMSFFDATPSGRILNRASTDQSAVDLNIPYQVASSAFTMIQLLGIIAVMSQVAWQVFVIFIPITAISIWYQQYYLPSARELSRLVGVCKAPVIQHFAETISGGTTIRSFGQQSRFWDTSMKLIDAYSRPNFYIAGAMEWLCIRLDLLSSVTFACSLIFLISVPVGGIDPAIAGLAVTYGLNLNMIQAWVIWNLCQLENKIISVERILQYTKIESEPPLLVEENRPDPSWPSLGEVNICSLEVRYAPHMPLVLRGITCTFQGQNKCGIVGRTGSGKSTLIQALFRIVEPTRGRIIIDGVDISAIGLHDLRSRLSIIPQEPTMFEGTVRSNLDPLEEFTDDQIWDVLDKCQLGDEVRGKEKKLDSVVAENGENWSMGQRQLVCLGRVLLKKSKILVLDEATASVDTATDNLIQHTLRHHFEDSTVLIIAHRITSVLDSDMVLVLDQGLVQECDAPSSLLQDKSSSFAKLVAEYTARSKSNHC